MCVAHMDVDSGSSAFVFADGPGWSIRRGHRRRLMVETGCERTRGRTAFSRSVGERHEVRTLEMERRFGGALRSKRTRWFRTRLMAELDDCVSGLRVDEYGRLAVLTSQDFMDDEEAGNEESTFADSWAVSFAPSPDSYLEEERQLHKAIVASLQASGVSSLAEAGGMGSTRQRAQLWEDAEEKATCAAMSYERSDEARKAAFNRQKLLKPVAVVQVPVLVATTASVEVIHRSFASPPPGAGGPLYPEDHDHVASFATRALTHSVRNIADSLGSSSDEYKAVAGYFLSTLNDSGANVKEVIRLKNPDVYERYAARSSGSAETIMFHGCRSATNESPIIRDGFQVSRCNSGGQDFGTWFAYGAAYSNCGYAFMDSAGVKHIFVCAVSYQHTVKDDCTMRVVGQDCAYPHWLIKYTLPLPLIKYTLPLPQVTNPAPSATGTKVWFEVRDGRWVPVKAP